MARVVVGTKPSAGWNGDLFVAVASFCMNGLGIISGCFCVSMADGIVIRILKEASSDGRV